MPNDSCLAEFAVIIPFFQRTPGLLRRAVESVKTQAVSTLTIVVDDESPLSADTEIRDISNVRVIQRKNGGPAAARNTGLDSIPSNIPYVAFLDSDDFWAPDHLARALQAFRYGATAYTANWREIGTSDGQDAYNLLRKLNVLDHQSKGNDLYVYSGDLVLQQLTNGIFWLSASCYDLSRYRHLRFCDNLRYASEDKIFSIKIALLNPVFWFSSRVEVQAGRGVNIYSGTQYASIDAVRQKRSQVAAMKGIVWHLEAENHKAAAHAQLVKYRRQYVMNILGLVRRSPFVGFREMRHLIADLFPL
jgi:succinoglycan biosynthesis protein ExoW